MLTDSHLFGELSSADLEDLADECIATFSEMEGKKGYKPSPDDIDTIEGSVLERWENYGGCCCGSVIGSRLRDYIEHGTPMDRDDSH